jgi:hypothetical protein
LFQPVPEELGSPLRPTLGYLNTGGNGRIYGLDSYAFRNQPENCVLSSVEADTGDQNCYFDLMSYCRNGGPEDVWPSSYTYSALLGSIFGTFPLPAAKQLAGSIRQFAPTGLNPLGGSKQQGGVPQGGPGGVQNYLIVRGSVNFSAGTAQFLPCLPLVAPATPPEEAPGTNFTLEALNATGSVLETVQFGLPPDISESLDPQAILTAGFSVGMTNNGSLHSLVLSGYGQTLATLTASPSAPAVTLTSPNGGQAFTGGMMNVTWSGSDADGDTLSYTVQYSADNGATWETLAVDWPSQNLTVDSSQLTATSEGLISVSASDGFNTATAQSAATFTVQPHAPSIDINAPMNGSVVLGNQQLFLDASVNDKQDGPLSGTNVQWSSDRDGFLGSGTVINMAARTLSEGSHTLTVKAVDADDLTNSATTKILVLHYPPPQLTLQLTPGVAGYSVPSGKIFWPSYYTNYALQGSSNLAAAWTAITNTPHVTGNQWMVNFAVTNRTSYFRLALQP